MRVLKVISWLLLIGGVVVAVLWSLVLPSTVSNSMGDASPQFILIVFGMMLLGLIGLIVTNEKGGGGGSGPPFIW